MSALDGKNKKRLSRTSQLVLDGNSFTTSDIFFAASNLNLQVVITEKTAEQIKTSRQMLTQFVAENRVIYGVNTSVGGFVNWLVPEKYAEELQNNLISAVATNVGAYFDDVICRAAMLVRLNSLTRGSSAISIENFNKLLKIYNAGIVPCIPCKGSLGASGDLGPLACIALVGTGKWKARIKLKKLYPTIGKINETE